MDYISETSKGSGVYRSEGVAGADGDVQVGSVDDVLAWGTSLDYNFNTLGYVLTEDSPATDEYYTENPAFEGWIFEVNYELSIAGSVFGDEGFGELNMVVHDSSNKIGQNRTYPPPIPEPATVSLLVAGAVVIMLRRKRS